MRIQRKYGTLLLVFVMISLKFTYAQKQEIQDKESLATLRHLMDSYQYGQACLVADFTIQLSNLYFGTDDFNRKKDILIPLYRKDSLNSFVLKQLANSYNDLQQADSAIFYYVKYLGLVPYDAGIIGKLTKLLIRKKDYTAGLYLTELFLAYDSTKTEILKLNAYCNFLLKEYHVATQRMIIIDIPCPQQAGI